VVERELRLLLSVLGAGEALGQGNVKTGDDGSGEEGGGEAEGEKSFLEHGGIGLSKLLIPGSFLYVIGRIVLTHPIYLLSSGLGCFT
jgi:hypothetical protein